MPLNINTRETRPNTPAFDITQFDRNTADQPTASVNGVTVQTNVRTLHSTFSQYRADKTNNVDLSIARQLRFHDYVTAELRMEAFNALNHAQFSAPSLTPTSTAFGQISSQANTSRILQISAHIRF